MLAAANHPEGPAPTRLLQDGIDPVGLVTEIEDLRTSNPGNQPTTLVPPTLFSKPFQLKAEFVACRETENHKVQLKIKWWVRLWVTDSVVETLSPDSVLDLRPDEVRVKALEISFTPCEALDEAQISPTASSEKCETRTVLAANTTSFLDS